MSSVSPQRFTFCGLSPKTEKCEIWVSNLPKNYAVNPNPSSGTRTIAKHYYLVKPKDHSSNPELNGKAVYEPAHKKRKLNKRAKSEDIILPPSLRSNTSQHSTDDTSIYTELFPRKLIQPQDSQNSTTHCQPSQGPETKKRPKKRKIRLKRSSATKKGSNISTVSATASGSNTPGATATVVVHAREGTKSVNCTSSVHLHESRDKLSAHSSDSKLTTSSTRNTSNITSKCSNIISNAVSNGLSHAVSSGLSNGRSHGGSHGGSHRGSHTGSQSVSHNGSHTVTSSVSPRNQHTSHSQHSQGNALVKQKENLKPQSTASTQSPRSRAAACYQVMDAWEFEDKRKGEDVKRACNLMQSNLQGAWGQYAGFLSQYADEVNSRNDPRQLQKLKGFLQNPQWQQVIQQFLTRSLFKEHGAGFEDYFAVNDLVNMSYNMPPKFSNGFRTAMSKSLKSAIEDGTLRGQQIKRNVEYLVTEQPFTRFFKHLGCNELDKLHRHIKERGYRKQQMHQEMENYKRRQVYMQHLARQKEAASRQAAAAAAQSQGAGHGSNGQRQGAGHGPIPLMNAPKKQDAMKMRNGIHGMNAVNTMNGGIHGNHNGTNGTPTARFPIQNGVNTVGRKGAAPQLLSATNGNVQNQLNRRSTGSSLMQTLPYYTPQSTSMSSQNRSGRSRNGHSQPNGYGLQSNGLQSRTPTAVNGANGSHGALPAATAMSTISPSSQGSRSNHSQSLRVAQSRSPRNGQYHAQRQISPQMQRELRAAVSQRNRNNGINASLQQQQLMASRYARSGNPSQSMMARQHPTNSNGVNRNNGYRGNHVSQAPVHSYGSRVGNGQQIMSSRSRSRTGQQMIMNQMGGGGGQLPGVNGVGNNNPSPASISSNHTQRSTTPKSQSGYYPSINNNNSNAVNARAGPVTGVAGQASTGNPTMFMPSIGC